MTLLTEATDVFASTADGRCATVFLARDQFPGGLGDGGRCAASIVRALDALAERGWLLSPRAMIEQKPDASPVAFASGFAHDVDVVGVFEAPSLSEAFDGITQLERAGWSRRFATQWLIGPREFAAVRGAPVERDREWGFLALWEWNDAWAAASAAARRDYDAECDIAFAADLRSGVDMTGRHRLDWASSWHHLGFWEAPSPATVDTAIREHERVADFKFTTSRHYIGRRTPLASFLAELSEQRP